MRLFPLIAVLAACGSTPDADPSPKSSGDAADLVTLVYQSRVDGEIEPCG